MGTKKTPAKKTKTSELPVRPAELRLAVHDAVVRLGAPTSPAELRKALPKLYQRPAAELTGVLDALAREGRLFAVKAGKASKYTDRDPASVLPPAIQAALRDGPLDKKQLAARVERAVPGFGGAFAEILVAQIARGAVREHPKAGKTSARLGLDPPDPTPFLAKVVKDLKALTKQLAPSGVTPNAIYAALGRALGLERATDPVADETEVRVALRELSSREPPGALLSVRGLRALTSLDKPRFDGAVLRLARDGELTLHHHDFPASLPEVERAALVQDAHGVHYVGVALREGGGAR